MTAPYLSFEWSFTFAFLFISATVFENTGQINWRRLTYSVKRLILVIEIQGVSETNDS